MYCLKRTGRRGNAVCCLKAQVLRESLAKIGHINLYQGKGGRELGVWVLSLRPVITMTRETANYSEKLMIK